MRILPLTVVLSLLGVPAFAQYGSYNETTMPLGGGWQSHTVTGPNGRTFNGTTMPLGGGWSSTTWTDDRGHSTSCTTMPLGGGWKSTNCY